MPQTVVLGDGSIDTVPPFGVGRIDLWPGWGKEDPLVIAMGMGNHLQNWLASVKLKGGSSIDDPSIEEHPAGSAGGGREVCHCHGDDTIGEGGKIDPRQGTAIGREFLLDDASAGLLNDCLASAGQLLEEGRLAPAGATGDQDESVQNGLHAVRGQVAGMDPSLGR